MGRGRRTMTRAATALALALALGAATLQAAPDPDLQLYIDFDSYEPFWDHRTWMFHDRSQNGFDVEMGNFGWDLALVPGVVGRALEGRHLGDSGAVLTDGEPVYAHGEGLTIAVWALLTSPGSVRAIDVGGPGRSVVAASITRDENGGKPRLWTGWSAHEDDGETWAFVCGVAIAVTDDWVHFAAVYDPEAELALVYIDGEEARRVHVDGEPASDWGMREPVADISMSISSRGEDPVYMDELRMYSRALSQAEIRALMQPEALLASSRVQGLATTWGALRQP